MYFKINKVGHERTYAHTIICDRTFRWKINELVDTFM